MNVLCLGAHSDDVECMAGGTIAKWKMEGHNIYVLTFTDGIWITPQGVSMRNKNEVAAEEQNVAEILGYSVENLGLRAMELQFSDALVVEVLKRLEQFNIDTIICPWYGDQAHDHEVVNRVAMAASKRIPRILMGQINLYLRDFFTPNLFVDITNHFDKKIEALQAYKGEWKRTGEDWFDYFDITSRYYGKLAGVKRAEGFMTNKYLL
jgi:LmbE family N-acetylglucosaminyl deacetylase